MSQGPGKGSHRRCILATPPFNSLFHHGHGEELCKSVLREYRTTLQAKSLQISGDFCEISSEEAIETAKQLMLKEGLFKMQKTSEKLFWLMKMMKTMTGMGMPLGFSTLQRFQRWLSLVELGIYSEMLQTSRSVQNCSHPHLFSRKYGACHLLQTQNCSLEVFHILLMSKEAALFQKYDEEMSLLDRISAQKLEETEYLRSMEASPRSISERICIKLLANLHFELSLFVLVKIAISKGKFSGVTSHFTGIALYSNRNGAGCSLNRWNP
ncbi:hypothetical protein S83_000020 [Arachis hypogaea]